MLPEFKAWPKISRLNREVIVTEKIDGTNGCVVVTAIGEVFAQSRSRVITLESDNYGFASWVQAHSAELRELGPGYHYGEWWGQGINRNYGLTERRFSLFNTSRWADIRPNCCSIVPILGKGSSLSPPVEDYLRSLQEHGSVAAPGFKQPEGIVLFHTASNQMFKVTLENDEEPKGKIKVAKTFGKEASETTFSNKVALVSGAT